MLYTENSYAINSRLACFIFCTAEQSHETPLEPARVRVSHVFQGFQRAARVKPTHETSALQRYTQY